MHAENLTETKRPWITEESYRRVRKRISTKKKKKGRKKNTYRNNRVNAKMEMGDYRRSEWMEIEEVGVWIYRQGARKTTENVLIENIK